MIVVRHAEQAGQIVNDVDQHALQSPSRVVLIEDCRRPHSRHCRNRLEHHRQSRRCCPNTEHPCHSPVRAVS
jgi:hypothetical protein